jgi:hypothetical protein
MRQTIAALVVRPKPATHVDGRNLETCRVSLDEMMQGLEEPKRSELLHALVALTRPPVGTIRAVHGVGLTIPPDLPALLDGMSVDEVIIAGNQADRDYQTAKRKQWSGMNAYFAALADEELARSRDVERQAELAIEGIDAMTTADRKSLQRLMERVVRDGEAVVAAQSTISKQQLTDEWIFTTDPRPSLEALRESVSFLQAHLQTVSTTHDSPLK